MYPPDLSHERWLWSQGYQAVCGIDEVGRGAFAGPLVRDYVYGEYILEY